MEDNRMKNCKRLQVIFTSVFCSCAAVSIGGDRAFARSVRVCFVRCGQQLGIELRKDFAVDTHTQARRGRQSFGVCVCVYKTAIEAHLSSLSWKLLKQQIRSAAQSMN